MVDPTDADIDKEANKEIKNGFKRQVNSLIHPGDFKQACRVLWAISREAEQLIGEVRVLVEITDVTRDTRPAWGLFLVFL